MIWFIISFHVRVIFIAQALFALSTLQYLLLTWFKISPTINSAMVKRDNPVKAGTLYSLVVLWSNIYGIISTYNIYFERRLLFSLHFSVPFFSAFFDFLATTRLFARCAERVSRVYVESLLEIIVISARLTSTCRRYTVKTSTQLSFESWEESGGPLSEHR